MAITIVHKEAQSGITWTAGANYTATLTLGFTPTAGNTLIIEATTPENLNNNDLVSIIDGLGNPLTSIPAAHQSYIDPVNGQNAVTTWWRASCSASNIFNMTASGGSLWVGFWIYELSPGSLVLEDSGGSVKSTVSSAPIINGPVLTGSISGAHNAVFHEIADPADGEYAVGGAVFADSPATSNFYLTVVSADDDPTSVDSPWTKNTQLAGVPSALAAYYLPQAKQSTPVFSPPAGTYGV
jgi:hypothetical protein